MQGKTMIDNATPRRGRPDDVRRALLQAAVDLNCLDRSPTLRELVRHARVGRTSGMNAVKKMRIAGMMIVCGSRDVPYRNRPVAEYVAACPLTVVSSENMEVDFSGLQSISCWMFGDSAQREG